MNSRRWIVWFSQLAALLVLSLSAQAQAVSAPEVPEALKVPPGEGRVLQAHASGVQIYVCGQAADGKPQWTLKAPEAELRDEKGALIGRHFAGPSWRHNDGSEVTGKAVARVDSPDPDSIPWLLVLAVNHAGNGALARVAHIQRIHTQGGQAPAGAQCDVAKRNAEVRVPYEADYYFYAPAEK